MTSLLNTQRPPAFCPGCAHERVVQALDRALQHMGLSGQQVVIVSDIGCSGLFDTFFNTHAFHGLHGRALTYATGLKMARPELTVLVTMGDGGLGIGGGHVLSTCRRNIDVTLLVLNNFNYGMTGGQCSATTPVEANVASGFLNRLERPLDICQVAAGAGAPYVARVSAYEKQLSAEIEQAIAYRGFSLMDIWGGCTGRYTKRNPMSPKQIEAGIAAMPVAQGLVPANERKEYSAHYRELARQQPPAPGPATVKADFKALFDGRREVLLLGSAGQRIMTAGELLCLSAMTGGLHATQKNDYPITVLRGHSISEVVISSGAVGYTGIQSPDAVIALAPEGIARAKGFLARLGAQTLIIKAASVQLPETKARVVNLDFKARRIKSVDWALSALAVLAVHNLLISEDMLMAALQYRFAGNVLQSALDVLGSASGLSMDGADT